MMYYWIFKRKWFKKPHPNYKPQPAEGASQKEDRKGNLSVYHLLSLPRCLGRVYIKACEPWIWSWIQAVNICRNAGGELPQFFSRKEQEELISIIKTFTDYFFVEAMFIYLKTANG